MTTTLTLTIESATITTDPQANTMTITAPLTEEIAKAIEKKSGRYKPKRGERYWCICMDGNGFISSWDGDNVDRNRHSLGNCFRTEEEVERAVARQQAYVRMCDKRDELGGRVSDGSYPMYIPYWHSSRNAWAQMFTYGARDFAFDSATQGNAFITACADDLTLYYRRESI